MNRRLQALERELSGLREECTQLRAQVRGSFREPFRVVDAKGRVILEVARRGESSHLRLIDSTGHFLVTLTGIPSGGSIVVHNTSAAEVVGIAAGAHGGTLAISDQAGQVVGWINVTDVGGHFITRDHEGRITSIHPTPGARERPAAGAAGKEQENASAAEKTSA